MLVPKDQYPFFVLHDTATNLKYHLTSGSISPKDIAPFIEDYFAGKLEPVMKSQPVPDQQEGPLVEVVGLTYKDIVLDDERDVFVEYYDPDCAPCLAIVPQLEKFAEAVAADERGKKLVTVAKMDLDANDALDSDIRGFPTIKLYPAGRKGQPVWYNGEQGHSLQKWAKFLKENGKYGVDVAV
ncbi:thioredoxin-like protein [Immersiella caudata]|uniref:Protein disulfide-isomerase n=1 Tax=Immersiella caudata TaxID=314043 RepID=A0AA39WCT9_9PEZI|nr:thioredoxin-like protein [Immersiella caudata]